MQWRSFAHGAQNDAGMGNLRKKIWSRVMRSGTPHEWHVLGWPGSQFARDGSATLHHHLDY